MENDKTPETPFCSGESSIPDNSCCSEGSCCSTTNDGSEDDNKNNVSLNYVNIEKDDNLTSGTGHDVSEEEEINEYNPNFENTKEVLKMLNLTAIGLLLAMIYRDYSFDVFCFSNFFLFGMYKLAGLTKDDYIRYYGLIRQKIDSLTSSDEEADDIYINEDDLIALKFNTENETEGIDWTLENITTKGFFSLLNDETRPGTLNLRFKNGNVKKLIFPNA
tara:strand:- start:2800 stop:3456 length:657 start_codon:yes stop_codon:yes gene_type:complete